VNIRNLILASMLVLVPALAQAKPISIKVKGMVCAFCAQGIEKKFKALPEISTVKVSLESKIVDLDTKADKDIADEQIKKIISDAGYDVLSIERSK
jgi:copper chaperone CopZ